MSPRRRSVKAVDKDLAQVLDASNLSLIVMQEGRIVHANARYLHALGVSLEEAIGTDPTDTIVDPGMREQARDRARRAQTGEVQPPLVYLTQRGDGVRIWTRVESSPCRFRGKPASLVIAQDVTGETEASRALRESEGRYRELVEGLPDGVVVHVGRTIVFANEPMARMVGLPKASDLVGKDAFDFLVPEQRTAASANLEETEAGRQRPPRGYSVKRSDGSLIQVEVSGREVAFGDQSAIQTVIRDITERKRAERSQAAIYRIAEASARATSLTELLESIHSAVGELMEARNFFIALKDPSGEAFTFPYHRDEKNPAPSRLPLRDTLCGAVVADRKPRMINREEMETLRRKGLPDLDPGTVSWIGVPLVLRDDSFGVLVVQSYQDAVHYTRTNLDLLSFVSHHIAEAIDRQRKEDQIEHLAYHDGLTGLANRILFEDRLTNALAQANRRNAPLAVLFVDLDRFKVINDSLGHTVGDLILQAVGKRLHDGLRVGDSLARRGGDEFLVLLPDTPPAGAALVAQKLIESIRPPIRCAGEDLTLSASCGIAVFPDNGRDPETLLKAADIAMYRAKEAGRDGYRLFNPDMNAAAQRRLTVETKLRRSIANGQIGPHFQPILDVAREAVVGAEALLRWSPQIRDTMPPREFIPVAEQSGLIVTLGAFVLREALVQAQEWPLSRGRPIRVSVNFAARQILDPACVDLILQVLRDARFPPERLQLEVTESAQITEDMEAVERLRALKGEGVSIAIDDFGMGYSSLSRLRHLPFDTLKIDGTFVREMPTDPASRAVAAAVISLGRNLGLDVVAEGVETEEQKAGLLSLDCTLMQGFLFAGAMPSAVLGAWVKAREDDPPPATP